jgi:hypothetical protein
MPVPVQTGRRVGRRERTKAKKAANDNEADPLNAPADGAGDGDVLF